VLVGEFNNWNPEEGVRLKKKEDGSMYAEIALAAGQSYQYRYLLNDGRWVNDSSSTVQNDVYGQPVENCVIEVPASLAKEVVSKKVAAPKKTAAVKKEAAVKKVAAPKKEVAPKKASATKKVTAEKKSAVPKEL
jgi:1,4-alpha-glucan branching enzyme